ncbi:MULTISPECIES: cation-translocating P-type ATPase [Hyphomicrobiales]|jgi:calcium-translocating P-type ATPase|uniref:cation-translocating P-type ATPase n=1 Tax=Hyphomicrobiales TaxID=356 RepID=UPI000829C389|nr:MULTISPECIES: HAD-IC family P-type ATPase [Hyphomicrobiales]
MSSALPAPGSRTASPVSERPWHALRGEEVLARAESRRSGLSGDEVRVRQARFGLNTLPSRKVSSWAALFARQFVNPLIALLLAATAVSAVLGETLDAIFILAVIFINAALGAIQEGKAERGAAALDRLVRQDAVAWRNGERRRVDATDLVPGDIVELESGVLVPADLRLLETSGISADESLLTGESLAVEKNGATILAEGASLGDRVNLAHAGSMILRGRGFGVVVATGRETEIGRIAASLTDIESAPPLVLRLRRFSATAGIVVVTAVLVFAAVQLWLGAPLAEIFFVSVALAVSAIPEGLPIAITVALAVAVRRMARRNVIVRALPAVEGLGARSLIASDKTGTLTLNRLTIATVWLPGQGRVDLTTTAAVRGDDLTPEALGELATVGALCNEASLGEGEAAVGDTVDLAFLAFAETLGRRREELVRSEPVASAIAYEPENRFGATFTYRGDRIRISVKGALETVLAMCEGGAAPAQDAAEQLAGEGHRVLAVAEGWAGTGAALDRSALRGLTLIGLVGLIDPLRPEARDAVRQAQDAGVRVCMVTGDHPKTAAAIAEQLGIPAGPEDVVSGQEIARLAADPAAFRALVARRRVFARVEPLQKLSIVEALREAGHFVAVTGDGVNDAPALAAAHIGVAMGRSGTDVARRAADLIVTDDNFASIVAGIEEGRIAYANIRKVIAFLISSSAAEIGIFFLCLLAGLPLPFVAVQLLWLNLVTDSVQHVALSMERGEPDLLSRGPRAPSEPLFDRRMIEQTGLAGLTMAGLGAGYFGWLLAQGRSIGEARNLLLLLMVCFQNVHVFNCRSERRSAFHQPLRSNLWIPAVVVLTQGIHIGAMHVPVLNEVLRIAPVAWSEWVQVAGISLLLIPTMEVYKSLKAGRLSSAPQ